VIERAEVDVRPRGVEDGLDGIEERPHAHLVPAAVERVDVRRELGLVVEAEAGLVDHLGAFGRPDLGPDPQLVEDVLVRVLFLRRDAVAGVGNDRCSGPGSDDPGGRSQDCRVALPVVVRAAVDRVNVGFGGDDVLGDHVGVGGQLLGDVVFPPVRDPERSQGGVIGLTREDPSHRVGRLRPGQVLGGFDP